MNWAGELRNDLRKRALSWASSQSLRHYTSLGQDPTVLFPTAVDRSSHGNFHLNSWRAIQASDIWVSRLDKVHTQATRALPIEMQAGARELDSSNSSDALLMNCFCFPGAATRIMHGLALMQSSPELGVVPVFGVKARLPLVDGREDTTEVDMRIGPYIFEAKLTEKNFTTADEELIRRYSAFESTFEVTALKRQDSQI
jgi:hypothetical protein